ncbi:hypothetical protein L218DRAFT_950376 [Marasmius fiardii PR-910]|nr:hypothetical protein L218DRAFT_950376 [Marasmius fiardii PR-910]
MDPGGTAPPPGTPISAMNFPALDEIYGVLLIGVLLNCILFGTMVMQIQKLPTQLATLLVASPVITGLISTPVQMFMAWRISVITNRRVGIALVICFFSLLSLAGGCWRSPSLGTSEYRTAERNGKEGLAKE